MSAREQAEGAHAGTNADTRRAEPAAAIQPVPPSATRRAAPSSATPIAQTEQVVDVLADQDPAIEPGALRRVCGLFVTGVTVITTGVAGRAAGATVNSFTSVSLEPPLVLFCLHERSRLHGGLAESGAFAVNFLGGRQEPVARAFAGRQTAVFHDVEHHLSAPGVPVLSDALAYLACRIVGRFAGGDHAIILGEVVELGEPRRHREPLIFFEGAFGALEREHGAHNPIADG
jgi:flavin reductase (DIM6/NTAB) family NADH-FMN oxidoreductase RutF